MEDNRKRVTPNYVNSLGENEIFVFGSNLAGMHGGVDKIKPYVDEFIEFAKAHGEYRFLVTRIGCGIAGFRDEDIAPLFRDALTAENIYLPGRFIEVLSR